MADEALVRAQDSGSAGSLAGAADMPRLAAQRLRLASGLATVIGLIGLPLLLLRQPNLGARAGTTRPTWILGAGIALSVATYLAVRLERISDARKIDLGLVYLVLLSFCAGLFRHWLPYVESDVVRGVSPIALAVLFVAVAVPVPPTRMAVAACAAVVADVAALGATLALTDNPTPPWNLWLWLFFPDVVVVPVAVMTARTLYRLGETVRRAREMGAYRLVERLGAGGMGEVWRADHRTLARPAAIKLVRPELLGARGSADAASMLTRFEREARATARLTSPHTIAVYDFGRAEDGAFYYVMELLEGMDLEALGRLHGPMPEERCVHLLLQACHSLRDAHDNQLVHRDIKPANLFVCQRGSDRDFVKVLDFGLVKYAEGEPDAKLTDVGAVPGTPAYMAPELARGQEASASSDIYALGCVAYELIAGHMVFADRSHPMQQIVAHSTEPPPALDPALGTDPRLVELMMRCLSKDPADRPASVSELEAELRALGLAARWTPERAEAWWGGAHAPVSPGAELAPTLPADALAPQAP